MDLVLPFLAGAFLTMSIPHIVAGMQGKTHTSPLGKNSSALVNVVTGFVFLLIGAWIFSLSGRSLTSVLSFDSYSLSFLLVFYTSWIFLQVIA